MNQGWIRAMELELQRQAVISLLVTIVFLAIFFWILYLVLKAAIRDGIRESGLINARTPAWSSTVEEARHGDTVPQMPDMRAER